MATMTATEPPTRRSKPPAGDTTFRVVCQGAAMLVVALAAALVVVLAVQAWPFWTTHAGSAFGHVAWDPGKKVFGVWALIYGTLATSLIALLIAVPLGVGSAAYLSEIAPANVRRVGSFLIELLAAIPSVVYGFWGLLFLTPLVRKFFALVGYPFTSGSGILAAGLILAVMIVPYITAISFDVCRAVPRSQREGALALGATRWQMIRSAVLPFARPGIVAACFLALGRALGETMAVTMLIGNNAREIQARLSALGDSIASVIANQLNEATDPMHRSALVGLGLLLFGVTAVVNLLARILITRRATKPPPAVPEDDSAPPVGPRDLPALPPISVDRRPHLRADRIMTRVLGACLVVTVGPLFLILGYIVFRGVEALNWDFFTNLPAPPGEAGGGMAHAFGGSSLLVMLASLYAVPVGILAAVFLAEYRATRLSNAVRFIGELLGGVPSIVIGIFAYAVLVRTLGGFSAWAGAFALGVMMIPIVMRSAEESLKLVPQALRNASYALGATHWQTVLKVTVPAALPAIITGVFLAIGRIAGETAPLLLTAYGSNFWPRGPGDRTPFLPKYIYDYSRSGYDDWERQAWAAALVLVAVVMILNVGIRFLTGTRVVAASRGD
jgi:phosphate transport system permease protein